MRGEIDFTGLLDAARAGDAAAGSRLYELVYADLRGIARRHLRGGHDQGPRTTSLVHEAYLRLSRIDPGAYQNRVHFLSTASRAMRQILIDHARRRYADKRGGGVADLDIADVAVSGNEHDFDLLALDMAIAELERDDAELARIVEWRFFGGLTVPEIAEAAGCSESTVKRDLREASAYLRQRIAPENP
jgi:RNA polymerase sigma factor (TIGR02999 family)